MAATASIWSRLEEQKEILDATERKLTKHLNELLKDDEEQEKTLSLARQINVTYTNYKGETSERKIIPYECGLRFGSSKWHLEPQWLLSAYDVEKKADREFALKDIKPIQ